MYLLSFNLCILLIFFRALLDQLVLLEMLEFMESLYVYYCVIPQLYCNDHTLQGAPGAPGIPGRKGLKGQMVRHSIINFHFCI